MATQKWIFMEVPKTQTHELKGAVVQITPEIAADYLSRMEKNRTIKVRHLQDLVEMLKQGEWRLNGETIKFDWHGRLADGQHRLQAVVQSGVTVESVVIWGIDPQAFPTIDIGKIRTFGDLAGLLGYENANTLGGALNMLYTILHIEGERQFVRILPKPFLLEYLQKQHEGMIQSVSQILPMRTLAAPSALAACHYLCARADADAADQFFTSLHQGTNLEAGSPILLLSKKLTDGRMMNRRYKPVEIAAFILKAWNAVRRGQRLQFLRWSVTEQFPRVDGLPQVVIDEDMALPHASLSRASLQHHTPQSMPSWMKRRSGHE